MNQLTSTTTSDRIVIYQRKFPNGDNLLFKVYDKVFFPSSPVKVYRGYLRNSFYRQQYGLNWVNFHEILPKQIIESFLHFQTNQVNSSPENTPLNSPTVHNEMHISRDANPVSK